MSFIHNWLGLMSKKEIMDYMQYTNKKIELIHEKEIELEATVSKICTHRHLTMAADLGWTLRLINTRFLMEKMVARCEDCGRTFTKAEFKKAGLKKKDGRK